MKNLLKKLSRPGGSDRLAELEKEAAEQIKAVGGQRPPEADAPIPAPASSELDPPYHEEQPRPTAPSGRRMTVQERVAARQLQSQSH